MARLFYQGLVAMALIGGSAADQDLCVVRGEYHGGDHGEIFDDFPIVTRDTTVTEIRGRAGEVIDSIGVCQTGEFCTTHGGDGGTYDTCVVPHGFVIDRVEIHQKKHKKKTKVCYMKFSYRNATTPKDKVKYNHFILGKPREENAPTTDIKTYIAPGNGRLIGLFGKIDGTVIRVGILWSDGDCANSEKMKTAAPPVQAPLVGPPYPGVPLAGYSPYSGVPPAGYPPYPGVPPPGYPSYNQGAAQNPHSLSIDFNSDLGVYSSR